MKYFWILLIVGVSHVLGGLLIAYFVKPTKANLDDFIEKYKMRFVLAGFGSLFGLYFLVAGIAQLTK